MADNKNMKLDDEMIAKANGGTAEGGSAFKLAVGDHVTMIGKEGTVTEAYEWHGVKMYAVHWIANEYGPEEDQRDIPENMLD